MRLSPRIYALAGMIRQGESAADIGTDHGYVPMLLMRGNISPFVIMSDISEGSLSKAKETFELAGIEVPEENFRVGDGLSTLRRGETDAVIIGGLGGFTIRNILAEDPDKTRSFSRLVMQPRKHSGALREYLYINGYDITEEVLTEEGKFICEIIAAEPSPVLHRDPCYGPDDIRWYYPESFRDCDHRFLSRRLDWKLRSIEEEISNLRQSRADQSGRIERLRQDYEYLTGLLEQKMR